MTVTALTKEQRDALPDGHFAFTGRRLLPIHDQRHVSMAWSQVDRVQGPTQEERADARERILTAARHLDMDTRDWERVALSYHLEAMSLDVPEDEHPNRMPFSGVLVRLDEPSDAPPGGSEGHRTLISTAVAERALSTLLGMAVDYKPDLSGHDKKSKIGVITGAEIEGNAIRIAGFLYASDFPEECARIKREMDDLGFSYECQAAISDLEADPWVVTRCTFTGAAVLYKHLAAYTTTSLAAQAEKETDMTPEELAAAIAAALKPLAASVEAIGAKVGKIEQTQLEAAAVRDKVKPFADTLRACAAQMEAAGIGNHDTSGHANVLRHMAASMEAQAVMGTVPHEYSAAYVGRHMEAGADKGGNGAKLDAATEKRLGDMQTALEASQTVIKDLQAKAAAAANAPERKTFPPAITALLAKHDLTAAADGGKLTIAQVDKALAGLPIQQRIAQKLELQAAGVLSGTAA